MMWPTPVGPQNYYGNHVASSLASQGNQGGSYVTTGHLQKMMPKLANDIAAATEKQINKHAKEMRGVTMDDAANDGSQTTTTHEGGEEDAIKQNGMRNFMESAESRMTKLEAKINEINEDRKHDKVEQQKQQDNLKLEVGTMFQESMDKMMAGMKQQQEKNLAEFLEGVRQVQGQTNERHKGDQQEDEKEHASQNQNSGNRSPKRKKPKKNRVSDVQSPSTPQKRNQQVTTANENRFEVLMEQEESDDDMEETTLVPDSDESQEDGEVVEVLMIDEARARAAAKNEKKNREASAEVKNETKNGETGPVRTINIATPDDEAEEQVSPVAKEKKKQTQQGNHQIVRLSSTETRAVRRLSSEENKQQDNEDSTIEDQGKDKTQSNESEQTP